jgi:hypothetical protein
MKYFLSFWLIFLAVFFSTTQAQSQCDDVFAANFDPADSLSVNCKYSIAVQNPPFLYELPKKVEETSGLIFFDDLLWTHNDSGGEAVLYGLDTANGQIVRKLKFPEIKNSDWEDVALNEEYIFIGDFGNNSGSRKDLHIHRVKRSDVPGKGDAKLETEKIQFHFEDQEDFSISLKFNNFDCEAMVVGEENIYLFTKNRGDQHSRIYQLPSAPGNHVAKLIGRFDSEGLITGADYLPAQQTLVLIGYTNKTWKPFVWLFYGFEQENFLSGNKRKIDLLNLLTTQVDGIAFVNPWQVMISAESSKSFTARAFKMDLRSFLSPYQLALEKGNLLPAVSFDNKDKTFKFSDGNPKTGFYQLMLFDAENHLLIEEKVPIEADDQQFLIDSTLSEKAVKAALFGKRHTYYYNF